MFHVQVSAFLFMERIHSGPWPGEKNGGWLVVEAPQSSIILPQGILPEPNNKKHF